MCFEVSAVKHLCDTYPIHGALTQQNAYTQLLLNIVLEYPIRQTKYCYCTKHVSCWYYFIKWKYTAIVEKNNTGILYKLVRTGV